MPLIRTSICLDPTWCSSSKLGGFQHKQNTFYATCIKISKYLQIFVYSYVSIKIIKEIKREGEIWFQVKCILDVQSI